MEEDAGGQGAARPKSWPSSAFSARFEQTEHQGVIEQFAMEGFEFDSD